METLTFLGIRRTIAFAQVFAPILAKLDFLFAEEI
jgi:hypothetical protein